MDYLSSTYYFDYKSDEIQELISEFMTDSLSKKEKTIGLYLKVRDSWRYDPYNWSFIKEVFKACKNCDKIKRSLC